jgi:hypothetical protein
MRERCPRGHAAINRAAGALRRPFAPRAALPQRQPHRAEGGAPTSFGSNRLRVWELRPRGDAAVNRAAGALRRPFAPTAALPQRQPHRAEGGAPTSFGSNKLRVWELRPRSDAAINRAAGALRRPFAPRAALPQRQSHRAEGGAPTSFGSNKLRVWELRPRSDAAINRAAGALRRPFAPRAALPQRQSHRAEGGAPAGAALGRR